MLYYKDTKLRSRRRLRKGLYTRAKSLSKPLTRLYIDVAGAVLQRRYTKVVKYLKVSPTTQCTSCHKFGHIGDRCFTRAYRYCAAIYLS